MSGMHTTTIFCVVAVVVGFLCSSNPAEANTIKPTNLSFESGDLLNQVNFFGSSNHHLLFPFSLASSKNSAWQTWPWKAEPHGEYTFQFTARGTDDGAFDVLTMGALAPVPVTLLLLSAGLVGLYGIRRRFQVQGNHS